jgi:hypothetical protein
MVPFLMMMMMMITHGHGLAIIQIHMPYQLMVIIMMDAGWPEKHITLDCQQEPFDRD